MAYSRIFKKRILVGKVQNCTTRKSNDKEIKIVTNNNKEIVALCQKESLKGSKSSYHAIINNNSLHYVLSTPFRIFCNVKWRRGIFIYRPNHTGDPINKMMNWINSCPGPLFLNTFSAALFNSVVLFLPSSVEPPPHSRIYPLTPSLFVFTKLNPSFYISYLS